MDLSLNDTSRSEFNHFIPGLANILYKSTIIQEYLKKESSIIWVSTEQIWVQNTINNKL